MSIKTYARRAAAPAALLAGLLLLPVTVSAQPGPFPGLPLIEDPGSPFPDTVGTPSDRNEFSWLNGPYNGRAGSVRSEQWLRLPTRALALNATFATCVGPANEFQDNPCPFPVPDDTSFASPIQAAAFLVSPRGADHPYGEGEVIPVRTVAFGTIPVVVEVQINQARDADGLPIPLEARIQERYSVTEAGDRTSTDAATLSGDMRLRVVSLAIDGVDVGLGACRTVPFGISLSSEPSSGPPGEQLRWVDPDRSAYGLQGGTFAGVADIPALTGCRTRSGDDASAVLSSFLAGPGNPVSIRYGAMGCFGTDDAGEIVFGPTPPGADTPEAAGCVAYEQVPGDPRWNSIPEPREFPDHAPGEPGR